jgi:DNA-binding transcriptional regulator PaaX
MAEIWRKDNLMSKYKYYLKKPKSEIVKDIFKGLAISGAVCVAATSPYFVVNLMRGIQSSTQYKKKKVYDTFYKLKQRGYINLQRRNNQIYISLTEEGKKRAGRFQIDSLEVKKSKKWDKKWRIVIFDIAQLKKLQRDIFRGKLKELGFIPLQKSVWVHAFPCRDEIALLREFFGLSEKEICLIVAESIENEDYLKGVFNLK